MAIILPLIRTYGLHKVGSAWHDHAVPRVSQDHLDARRHQILDGARICFARYGYEGATVRRLEDATGLSRGAIFHHFRDKETLFLALAEDDAVRMADVVAEQGLVQVMRNLVTDSQVADSRAADSQVTDPLGNQTHPVDWLGTRLEVSRRLRTDPDFRSRWAQRSEQLTKATVNRLQRQKDAGKLRDDVELTVLADFLELVLEGVVSHLAMGLPANELAPVLDLVEETVRRHRGTL